jgi:hypothetical protein
VKLWRLVGNITNILVQPAASIFGVNMAIHPEHCYPNIYCHMNIQLSCLWSVLSHPAYFNVIMWISCPSYECTKYTYFLAAPHLLTASYMILAICTSQCLHYMVLYSSLMKWNSENKKKWSVIQS